MDYPFLIVLSIIIIIIAVLIIRLRYRQQPPSSSNKSGTSLSDTDNSFTKENEPVNHTAQFQPEPVISNHAKQRLEERCKIHSFFEQVELVNRANAYGKTKRNTTADLKAQLESIEAKYDKPTVAKFYNGFIFIFSEEDNTLITVYPSVTNANSRYYS